MAPKDREFTPLSTGGLMKHLRDDCGVEIHGSTSKRKLQNIGYYHGYKGYRFVREERSPLPISSFAEIEQLFLLDIHLKSAFYPWLMRVETSIKNCVLESVCDYLKSKRVSASFDSVCKNCLTGAGQKEKYEIQSYLAGKISANCNKHDVIKHFTGRLREVPIWALLEILTLGEFVKFYGCLCPQIKDDIYTKLKMPQRIWDKTKASKYQTTDYLKALLYAMTSIRNCVAHNSIIADARFAMRNQPSKETREFLGNEFGLKCIAFDDLTDYLLITVYLMAKLNYTKTDRKQLVSSYVAIFDEYKIASLNPVIFKKVIGGSYVLKAKAALEFIRNN